MRKLGAVFAAILGIILALLLLELLVPAAHGITGGVLRLFWSIFAGLYLSDMVISIVLYVLIAVGIFGTVWGLSAKRETKIWGIVSPIVSLISLVLLLLQNSRSS